MLRPGTRLYPDAGANLPIPQHAWAACLVLVAFQPLGGNAFKRFTLIGKFMILPLSVFLPDD